MYALSHAWQHIQFAFYTGMSDFRIQPLAVVQLLNNWKHVVWAPAKYVELNSSICSHMTLSNNGLSLRKDSELHGPFMILTSVCDLVVKMKPLKKMHFQKHQCFQRIEQYSPTSVIRPHRDSAHIRISDLAGYERYALNTASSVGLNTSDNVFDSLLLYCNKLSFI